MSMPEHQPWWRVSLDFSYRVRAVVLWLKTDTPIVDGDSLANATVHVGDSISNEGTRNTLCGKLSDTYMSSVVNDCPDDGYCPALEVVCDSELYGRYVTITIPPPAELGIAPDTSSVARVLSLCEVQVFGVECDARCAAQFTIPEQEAEASPGVVHPRDPVCATLLGNEKCDERATLPSSNSHVSTWGVDH